MVALALGQSESSIAMLSASERALPDDYNPPARLALAFKAAKRYDDALEASARALRKVYGPRRLLVLRQRAEILIEKGDRGAARTVLDQALAQADALPAAQRSERAVAAIRQLRAGL